MDENTQVNESAAKAFDMLDLADRLRAAGLPVLEELLHKELGIVVEWVEYGVTKSETKFDDFALAFIPAIRKYLDSKIDFAKGVKAELPEPDKTS